MTFKRALAADVVAMVVALALLFVMGLDWYSTTAGDEARRVERFTRPQGALGGEVQRDVERRARASAEDAEKNAFGLTGAIDRAILACLLATAMLALAAGFTRAAGARFEPPLTPSALAAAFACATALLVAARMIEQPGLDVATTVRSGAPVTLIVLGVVALASAAALRAEQNGTAWREAVAPATGEAAGATQAAGAEPSIESKR